MRYSGCGALILIGGQSRRMGVAKSGLQLQRQSFLERIVQTLNELALPIWIVTGVANETNPIPAGARCVHDEFADRGPIEGLRCGLKAASSDADWLFVSSCDSPLLNPDVVKLILERRTEALDVVVPYSDPYFHPLCAAYHQSALLQIEHQIASGNLSLQKLLHNLTSCRVSLAEIQRRDPGLDSLRNINTPQDYAELLASFDDCD